MPLVSYTLWWGLWTLPRSCGKLPWTPCLHWSCNWGRNTRFLYPWCRKCWLGIKSCTRDTTCCCVGLSRSEKGHQRSEVMASLGSCYKASLSHISSLHLSLSPYLSLTFLSVFVSLSNSLFLFIPYSNFSWAFIFFTLLAMEKESHIQHSTKSQTPFLIC